MTLKKVLIAVAVLGLVLAACGGSSSDGDNGGSATTTAATGGGSGDPSEGAEVYQGTCAACHGPTAGGIDGLGKPLAPSEFVTSNTEDELVAFIKVGRPAGDPANTQGVDMPPKGGNPSLTDEDLHDVAAYIKSLN
ncbi:MAG: cytochrome c [Acidimicrobiia bacterium]